MKLSYILILLIGIPQLLVSGVPIKEVKKGNEPLDKVMIMALIGNLNNRKTLEDEIRIDMAFSDMKAISSYNSGMSIKERPTKESVISTCQRLGVDGVLVVRILNSEAATDSKVKDNHNVQVGVYYWGPYPFTHGGNYVGNANTKVVVEALMYSIPDGELLFESRQTLRIISDVEGVIGDYAGKLTRRLKKKKIVAVQD